jgi:RNA polymerase sigma-70 factor (ECF subfamily)
VSFEAVYERHFDFVWRNVRRMGVSDGAVDDAVQDVFLVVHRRLGEFEGRSSLETWLFGIVLRVVRDHRRARARRDTRLAEVQVTAETIGQPSGEGPHDDVARRQAVALLYRLLDELDEDKRAVFVLVELEERSVPEVAAALGLNLNTAYARLRAARQQFEAAMARQTATAGAAAGPTRDRRKP